MFRRTRPLYLAELVSHRVLRYSTGVLHIGLLASSVVLRRRGRFYRLCLGRQVFGLSLAAAGKARLPVPGARLAYYYYVVTKATAAGLVRYLRTGTPQMWDKAKGTPRDEPRLRRRASAERASSSRARSSASPRSRPRSRTAGLSSIGRSASAAAARTSSS